MAIDDVATSYEQASLRLVESDSLSEIEVAAKQMVDSTYLSDAKRSLGYGVFWTGLAVLSEYAGRSVAQHPVDDVLFPLMTASLGLVAAKKLYDAGKSFLLYKTR